MIYFIYLTSQIFPTSNVSLNSVPCRSVPIGNPMFYYPIHPKNCISIYFPVISPFSVPFSVPAFPRRSPVCQASNGMKITLGAQPPLGAKTRPLDAKRRACATRVDGRSAKISTSRSWHLVPVPSGAWLGKFQKAGNGKSQVFLLTIHWIHLAPSGKLRVGP